MEELKTNEKQLIVKKIDNGIVIDHIRPPGRAFHLLKALNIDENYPHSVFVAINVPSKKYGRKDVLKIRNVSEDLLHQSLDVLGLLIAGSNIVYIENYEVVKKEKIKAPERAIGLMSCPGISCITNLREDVETDFIILPIQESLEGLKLRCTYCDKIFNVQEHISLLL